MNVRSGVSAQGVFLLTVAFCLALSSCSERTVIQACEGADADPHLLFVTDDVDGDGIPDPAEACCTGARVGERDSDGNGRPDGVDLSLALTRRLSGIPERGEAVLGSPCKYEHDFVGQECCRICGEEIQRGVLCVINPLSEQEVALPYMALHYMEHGCLAYAGTSHTGQVSACALQATLLDCHITSVENDSDGDFLSLEEEQILGLDPEDPDENQTWGSDGIELAGALYKRIQSLPIGSQSQGTYKVFRESSGNLQARCHVCGLRLPWGCGWEIVNLAQQRTFYVSDLSVHFLERGSFSSGPSGVRVDLPALCRIVEIDASDILRRLRFELTLDSTRHSD